MVQKRNISIHHGDDSTLVFNVKQDEEPLDLDGARVEFTFYDQRRDQILLQMSSGEDGVVIPPGGVVKLGEGGKNSHSIDLDEGQIMLVFPQAITQSTGAVRGFYELKVYDETIYTVAHGSFEVRK